MKKNKLIYIGPMGHSGSTLLDLMLHSHSDITSVGEVQFYDEWYLNNYLCSCSKPIKKCDFWQKVRIHLSTPQTFFLKGHISTSWNNSIPWWDPNLDKAKEFGFIQNELFNSIQKINGNKIILDSSKCIARLKMLIKSDLFDIKILHLIRDPRAVGISCTKSTIRPSIPGRMTSSSSFTKAILRWNIRNASMEKLKKQYPNISVLRIRYEDICMRTENTMKDICKFIDIHYLDDINKPNTENIHNISGSRWRYKENVSVIYNNDYIKQLTIKNI